MSLEGAKEKLKELLDDSDTTDLDIALFLRNFNPIEMFIIAQGTRADRSLVTDKRLWDEIGSEYLAIIDKKLLNYAPRTYNDRYCLSLVTYIVSKPALFSRLNIHETHTKQLMFKIYNVDNGKLEFFFNDTNGADNRKLILLIRAVLDQKIPNMYTVTLHSVLIKKNLKRNAKVSILYRIMQLPNVSVECPIDNEGSSMVLVQEEMTY